MSAHHSYKRFERSMTAALIAGTVIFVVYLIAAAAGIIWLKWLLAIAQLLLDTAGLIILYLSKELTRPRSLWMGCGCFALLVCTLVSLILNYPA